VHALGADVPSHRRGVVVTRGCGGNSEIHINTSRGTTPVVLTVDLSEVSAEQCLAWVVEAERWLESFDPPLRLVGEPPLSGAP
jgi:hypothetical protein